MSIRSTYTHHLLTSIAPPSPVSNLSSLTSNFILQEHLPPHAVFASNTSAIPIARIAEASKVRTYIFFMYECVCVYVCVCMWVVRVCVCRCAYERVNSFMRQRVDPSW
jgi:hypothetical protein